MNKSKYTISFVRTERQPADQDGPAQDFCYEEEIDFIFYSLEEAAEYIKNNAPLIWVNHLDWPTTVLSFDVWQRKPAAQVSFDPDAYLPDDDLVGSFNFTNPPQTNGNTNNI